MGKKKQVKCCKHGDGDYAVYLLPHEDEIARGETNLAALKTAANVLGITDFEVDLSGTRHKFLTIAHPSCELEVELVNSRSIVVDDLVVGPSTQLSLEKNVLYKATGVTEHTITFQNVETNEVKSSIVPGKDKIYPQVWKVVNQICNESGWTKIDDLCYVSNFTKGEKKELTVLFLNVDLKLGDIHVQPVRVWSGLLRQYTSIPAMARKAYQYAIDNPSATETEDIEFHFPEEVEKYFDMPSGCLAHLGIGNEETFYLYRALKSIFLAHVERFARTWLTNEELNEILVEASPRSGLTIADLEVGVGVGVWSLELENCGLKKGDEQWLINMDFLLSWFKKEDKHRAPMFQELVRDLHSSIYSTTLPSNVTDLESIYHAMTAAGYSIEIIEAAIDRLDKMATITLDKRSGNFTIDLYKLARIMWDPDLAGPDIKEQVASFVTTAIANISIGEGTAPEPKYPNFLRIRVRSPGKTLWEPIIKKGASSYIISSGKEKNMARFRTLDIGELHMPEREGIIGIAFVRGVPKKPGKPRATVETDDWKTQAIVCERRVLSLPDQYSDEILIEKFLARYKSTVMKFLQREYDEKIEDIKIVTKGSDFIIEFQTNKTGGEFYDDSMLLDFLLALEEKKVGTVEEEKIITTGSMPLKERMEAIFTNIKALLNDRLTAVQAEANQVEACKEFVVELSNALQLFSKTKYPIQGHLVIRFMDMIDWQWPGLIDPSVTRLTLSSGIPSQKTTNEITNEMYSITVTKKLLAFSKTVSDDLAFVFRNVLLEFLRESRLYVTNLQPYLEEELKSASPIKGEVPTLETLAERLVTLGVQKTYTLAKRFLQHQIKIGTSIERKHVTDRKLARQMALQHLADHWDYYIKISEIEKGTTDAEQLLEKTAPLANLALSQPNESGVKGFVWSNVDGDVVIYTPDKLLEYITADEDEEDSLRNLLESDDSAVAHVGLMQKVDKKPKLSDLDKYIDTKEGFLEALKDIKEHYVTKGQFLEINEDVIEEYEEDKASYNLWVALPGFSDIFGYADFEKPKALNKHIKAVADKLAKYLSDNLEKYMPSSKETKPSINDMNTLDMMIDIVLSESEEVGEEVAQMSDELETDAERIGFLGLIIDEMVKKKTASEFIKFGKNVIQGAIEKGTLSKEGEDIVAEFNLKYMKRKPTVDAMALLLHKLVEKQATMTSTKNLANIKLKKKDNEITENEPKKNAKREHILQLISQISKSDDMNETERLESEFREEVGEKLLRDASVQTVLYDPEGADLRKKITTKFNFPISVFDNAKESDDDSTLSDILDYAKERIDDYVSILGKDHEHSVTGTIGKAVDLYNRVKKQSGEGNLDEDDLDELIEFVKYEIDYALKNGIEDEELEQLNKAIDSFESKKFASIAIDEDTFASVINYEKDQFTSMSDDDYAKIIQYIKDRMLGKGYKKHLGFYATRDDAMQLYNRVRAQRQEDSPNQDDLTALLELVKWQIDYSFDSGLKTERLVRLRSKLERQKLRKLRRQLKSLERISPALANIDISSGSEKDKKLATYMSADRREALQDLYNDIVTESNNIDEATSEFEERAKKEGFTPFEIKLFSEIPGEDDETGKSSNKANIALANLIGAKDDWVSNLLSFSFSEPVKLRFGNFEDSKSRSDFLYMFIHAIDTALEEHEKLKNYGFYVGDEIYNFRFLSGKEALYTKAKDDEKHHDFLMMVNEILTSIANKIDFKAVPVTKIVGIFIEMCKDDRGIIINVEDINNIFPYKIPLANLTTNSSNFICLRKIADKDDATKWIEQFYNAEVEEEDAEDGEHDFSKVLRSIRFNSLDDLVGYWDEEHEKWEIPASSKIPESPFTKTGKTIRKGWKEETLKILSIIDGKRNDANVTGYTHGNYALVDKEEYNKVAY